MELTAAGNLECIRCFRVFYTKSHVRFDFLVETGTDMAGSDEVTLTAGKWALIDMEYHGQGRFVDVDRRQCFRVRRISDRFTDIDIFEAGHSDDVADLRFIDRRTFHALPVEELSDMVASDLFAIGDSDRHPLLRGTAGHTADSDLAEVVIRFERGDHDLQAGIRFAFRAWDILQDRIKERVKVLAFIIHVELGDAASCRCIEQREIELVIVRIEFHEELEDLAFDIGNTLIRTVDLIDDDDRLQLVFQRFSQDVLRLRHRSFMSIDEEQYAIDHVQDTFNFAAEVRMPWGVDDIDLHTVMHDRGIFRQDGDAAFTFQWIRVHDA